MRSFYTGDIYCSALCHPHLDTIAKSKTGINCVFGITISYYSLCMQYLMHTEEWIEIHSLGDILWITFFEVESTSKYSEIHSKNSG